MDFLSARGVKGTMQSGGPFLFFKFKFLLRSTQELELPPFVSHIEGLVTNYHSWDCDLRTELQQVLQSLFLFSKVAPLILEMGKVMFSTCQEEWEKYYKLYFIQSTALQFLRSISEVECYCGSKPRDSDLQNVWFLHSGKGCLGKAGTTPVQMQTLGS